ncbi:DUF488 family protein [Corynebacterium ulceribovis]|uniref:DUF488 domain-containing protein n=1 Tax=Corynebacterium ulceribovis TaxID=487732 RepID=UPI000375494C|nr:DUF488 domain-containing protein [Corynebacterium ulceribovis]
MGDKTLCTIGHSTRSADEFVDLLKHYEIVQVADVRTVPKSRHNPQFGTDELAKTLAEADIDYRWFKQLGGLRHAKKDSTNTGWRNASFRGYADYMQTPEFVAGLDDLMFWAAEGKTVVMCAEAVPWRCHRSMIGDALLVRGYDVFDIMSPTKATPEKLTSFAKVDGREITYPPEGAE